MLVDKFDVQYDTHWKGFQMLVDLLTNLTNPTTLKDKDMTKRGAVWLRQLTKSIFDYNICPAFLLHYNFVTCWQICRAILDRSITFWITCWLVDKVDMQYDKCWKRFEMLVDLLTNLTSQTTIKDKEKTHFGAVFISY